MKTTSRRSRRIPCRAQVGSVASMALVAVVALLFPHPAAAQEDLPSVLILGSPSGPEPFCLEQNWLPCANNTDCRLDDDYPNDTCYDPWSSDVQDKLLSTGRFSAVDTWRIDKAQPILANLTPYDSVLVFSDGTIPPYWQDPAVIPPAVQSVLLGDVLANYVDLGGGVVLAVFANASLPIEGRFANDDYWVINPIGQGPESSLSLGTVHDPGSPLMNGVSSSPGSVAPILTSASSTARDANLRSP